LSFSKRGAGAFLGSVAGLVLLCLFVFGDFLLSTDPMIVSSTIGDTARYFVFARAFVAEQLLAGNVPLWNPHSFAGTPLVAAFQSAVFYPLNITYLFLPLDAAINLEFALHLVLLGSFVFLWLRARGLAAPACFVAGVVVAFGGANFLRVLAGQLSVLNTIAWTPLLLLSVDRLRSCASEAPPLSSARVGWMSCGVGAGTLMLLAGHPPTVFMLAGVVGVYCLPGLVGGPRRLVFGASLVPIAVLPLLLGAVQLWTGAAASGESIRAGGMSYDFATSFSFPPESLLTLAVPEAFGEASRFRQSYFGRWFHWDASAYMGAVSFALAIIGLVRGRGRLRWGCAALFVFTVLLALGRYTPFYGLFFHWIPGFEYVRAPSKFIFFSTLFAAGLVAVGLDRLLRDPVERRFGALVLGALAALLGALALWVGLLPAAEASGRSGVEWLASLNEARSFTPALLARWNTALCASLVQSAAFCAAAALALVLVRGQRPYGVWLVIALAVMELAVFAHANRGGARPKAEYLTRPGLARAYKGAGHDRVLLARKTSNIAWAEGGFDLWGYDSWMLGRYAEFISHTQGRPVADLNNIAGHHPDVFHPLLSMLRGRFLVGRSGEIDEFPDPLPRFLLVSEYEVKASRQEVLAAMDLAGFDPRRTVLLEEEPNPAPAPPSSPGGGSASIRLLAETTDSMDLEVETSHAAVLVITDAYAEGWSARPLDAGTDRSYSLLPANYVLRAIPLAAGPHRIRVEYRPAAYRVGAWVSGLSGAACLATLAGWGWRRSGAPRTRED